MINYKLAAKSPWIGNEYPKRVYSRVANVARSGSMNHTVYSGNVLHRNVEEYQRYSFVCSRK